MAEAEHIEAVIPILYDAALAPEQWAQALARAARVLAAGVGTLTRRAIATGSGVSLGRGIDPPGADEFFAYFAPRSPLFRRVAGLTRGAIATDQDLLPKAEFQRSEIYNEYFLKHEVNALIAMPLWRDDSEIICVHFARPPKAAEFDHADKARLGRLAPHLQRAFTLARRLGLSEARTECGLELFERTRQAVLVVDGDAHVHFANGAAEGLLGAADGLAAGPGGLRGAQVAGTRRLRAAIARAASGADSDAVLLERAAAPPLYALATPLRGAHFWLGAGGPYVLLTLSDPQRRPAPAPRLLSELFGLTSAEASVALLLQQGRDLNATAAALGITRNTVRTHLRAALAKTGCHRQAELVLCLSALAQLGPDGRGQ